METTWRTVPGVNAPRSWRSYWRLRRRTGAAVAVACSDLFSFLIMKDDIILSEARQYGEEMHLDLWYPRNETSPVKSFVIGLMDVRAADDIRVSYDFKRDGWKIEQASTFSWDADDEECDPDWQEVAFVQAWGREKPSEENDEVTRRGESPNT